MKKLLFIICLFLSFSAHALTFETVPGKNGFTFIYLSGPIKVGDADAFEALMRKFQRNKVVALLSSPGGNLREGMLLGYYFYENDIPVGIENIKYTKANCESACALAYLGAKRMTYTKNSRLGVHRFYLKNAQTGSDREKPSANTEQDVQVITAYVYKYARMVEIPPEAIDIMFKTPSTSMYYFNHKEMEAVGAKYVELQ